MQEKSTDLTEMVKEFLAYKKVEYVELSAINVKQSNIVIGYQVQEKHPTIAGRTMMKEKWVEYNLSFMFSFLFQKASAQKATVIDSDLVGQIDALRKIVEGKNTPLEMEMRGLNERIDDLEARIVNLMKVVDGFITEKTIPQP